MTKVNWYLCCGLFFLLLVIGGFGMGAWKLHRVLSDANAVPVATVAVSGTRQFTTDTEIQQALHGLMQRSLFTTNVNQVQTALEQLPWVYRASVRRDWPDKLKVVLQEQQPVAHWNQGEWLNTHGQVFTAPAEIALDYLPYLAGPEASAEDVLQGYRQIRALLKLHGFGLKSLTLNPRHAWRAVLDNGILLELGREDKMARIQRFINVYPVLAKQDKKVARVDLRYDTGMAVGWDNAKSESR